MTLGIAGQHVLIIGAGKTGQSVAAFVAGRDGRVRLVERAEAILQRATLPPGIDARAGDAAEDLLEGIDVVVPSPGVARAHVLLRRALARGIPIISEIELAARS